jgi:hypothetical protein
MVAPSPTGIPPLSIAAGPSAADGMASGSAYGTTGAFSLGSRQSNWAETLVGALPMLILGGALIWAIQR